MPDPGERTLGKIFISWKLHGLEGANAVRRQRPDELATTRHRVCRAGSWPERSRLALCGVPLWIVSELEQVILGYHGESRYERPIPWVLLGPTNCNRGVGTGISTLSRT